MDIEPIALQVRASEIFFRSQIVNVAEDEIMLADEEMVNFHAKNLLDGSIWIFVMVIFIW